MTDAVFFKDLELDFNSMVRKLENLKPLSFFELERRVGAIQSMIGVVITAKKCGLTRDDAMKTLACQFSDEHYCNTAIEILERDLPVVETAFEHEEGEPFYMLMDCIGMNAWREEEIYELTESPNTYGSSYSLTAFLELINYGVTDEAPWTNCTEYFGWPIDRIYEVSYQGEFDEAYLKRYLKRHGAPPELFTTVMLTYFPPEDNNLLCITSDEWENDPACMELEITPENIRWLRKLAKQARKLCADISPAMEWIEANPQFIPILGDALEKSRKPEKVRLRV